MTDDLKCKCGKEFQLRGSLIRHRKTDHVEGECKRCGKYLTDKLEHKGFDCPKKKVELTCNQCQKIFTCSKNFGKHIYVHEMKSDPDYVFRQTFSNEFKLEAVKKVCEKGLKQVSMELKITTSTLKNWVTVCKDPKACHICGKVFPYKWGLELHIKRSHENVAEKGTQTRNRYNGKAFKNEVAKFAIENSLEGASEKFGVPIKTLKNWIKILKSPYICDFCGHSVAKKCELKIHMFRRHKTEMPEDDVDYSSTSFFKFVNSREEKISFKEIRSRNSSKGERRQDFHYLERKAELNDTRDKMADKNLRETRSVKYGMKDEIVVKIRDNLEEKSKEALNDEHFDMNKDDKKETFPNMEQKIAKLKTELNQFDQMLEEVQKKGIIEEIDMNDSVEKESVKEGLDDNDKMSENIETRRGEEMSKDSIKEDECKNQEDQIYEENFECLELNAKKENEMLKQKKESEQVNGVLEKEEVKCKKETEDLKTKTEYRLKENIKNEEKEDINEKQIVQNNSNEIQNKIPMDLLKKGNISSFPGAIFECKDCGYIPTKQTKREAQRHMRMHRELIGKTKPFTKSETVNLICEYCDESLSCYSNLQRHMLRHTGERNWQCTICTRRFGTKWHLSRHELTHSGEKALVNEMCKHCGKQFSSKKSRHVHELGHTGEFLYFCNSCDKGFNEKSIMHKHRVKKHGDSYSYFCDKCAKGFLSQGALNAHVHKCGQIQPKKVRKNKYTKSHPCTLCNKVFNRNCNLQRHIKMHKGEKEYSCDKCGKRFRDSRSVKSHTAKKHGSVERLEPFK